MPPHGKPGLHLLACPHPHETLLEARDELVVPGEDLQYGEPLTGIALDILSLGCSQAVADLYVGPFFLNQVCIVVFAHPGTYASSSESNSSLNSGITGKPTRSAS